MRGERQAESLGSVGPYPKAVERQHSQGWAGMGLTNWCNQASTKSFGRRGAGPGTSQGVRGQGAGGYRVAGVLGRVVACLVAVEGVVGRIVACGVAGVLGWVVDCVVAGPGLVRVAS